MRRKFDQIFSIEIVHEHYQSRLPADWETGDYTDAERAYYYGLLIPQFCYIKPVNSTSGVLNNCNMQFRATSNGGFIAIEKYWNEQDQEFILTRPLKRNIELVFALYFEQKSLLEKTIPFSTNTPPDLAELPYYSGIQRVMYFDNLGPDGNILQSGTLSISEKAGRDDFASIIAARHLMEPRSSGIERIVIDRNLPDQQPAESTDLTPQSRKFMASFSPGSYRIVQQPGNMVETYISEEQSVGSEVFAMISIFLTPQLLNTVNNRFKIIFSKP